jgi:riboflavin kinase / FMN adenylyltransferase
MKIFKGSKEAQGKLKNTVVTLGVFDGIHKGHQALIQLCKSRARQIKKKAVLYTFNPHPVKLLTPEACPALIMTLEQKIQAIKSLGIDVIVIETFNKSFSRLEPEVFFESIISKRLRAVEVVVGYNFTFGAQRKGSTQVLENLGNKAGIKVHVVKPYLLDDYLVSSTEIRNKIVRGDVATAARLLTRPFTLTGKVVQGDGIGKTLGFPTANLSAENELLPGSGVYASHTWVGKKRYRSITHVGRRPTFEGKTMRVETHILRLKHSIRNKIIQIEFLKKIREVKRFDSPAALVKQIKIDIQKTERYFKEQRT